MKTWIRPAGLGCALCCLGFVRADFALAALPAASVIYDNLTVNGGLNPAGASPASQFDAGFAFDAGAADDFVLPESPQCRWRITGARWIGKRWNGAVPGPITGFRIVFWPDEDGIPAGGGALTPNESQALASYHLGGNAGESLIAADACQYEAVFPDSLELAPGRRYWIQIQAELGYPPQWGLHITHGRQGQGPVAYFDLLGLAAWGAVPDNGDLAFELLGLPSEVSCDDGNACTLDTCVSGSCVSSAMTCDDGDPCTEDSCDPAQGCQARAMNCADDDGCTSDVCVEGTCQHYEPADRNGDGAVDVMDLAALIACLDPALSGDGACQCADLNHDGHVDLGDVAEFQRLFTGSK